MKTIQKPNTINQQILVRDTPAGLPVKTRVRAGLKLDGIKGRS